MKSRYGKVSPREFLKTFGASTFSRCSSVRSCCGENATSRINRKTGIISFEYLSRKDAKAQRRKENLQQRGSALRLCAFARDIFLCIMHYIATDLNPQD